MPVNTPPENGIDVAGSTTQRPSRADIGCRFWDTTLGKLFMYDGTYWNEVGGVPSTLTAAASVTTSGTITLPTGEVKLLTTAGAVTGVILTAGTYSGQKVTLVNTSANSITFAAAGTSNVADGTSAVLAANRAMTLWWDSTSARWYRTG